MKKKVLVTLFALLTSVTSVSALTLEGSIEQVDFIKKHRSFFARLFGPTPEGRIGVRISTAGLIGYIHPGSPAEKVGLQVEDMVLSVDGRKHAIDDISGDPGTKVHLEVQRHDETFAVDVDRIDYHEIAK